MSDSVSVVSRGRTELVIGNGRGTTQTVVVPVVAPIVDVLVVAGPPGPVGRDGQSSTVRIDASLAGTWVLPHAFNRIPSVQVFIGSGELALADVECTPTTVTVSHATPQQGFVLLS